MIRFAYLIPRLIIIVLIAFALLAGSDPLLRKIVISKLEHATGAKVEIGQLRSSLMDQKVFLNGVAITDPRSPMTNMVQADQAFFEFETASLLNRKIVIDSGRMSAVMFGVPRSENGILSPSNSVSEEVAPWEPKVFASAKQIGQTWLDQLPGESRSQNFPFELDQQVERMNKFWQPKFAELAQSIQTIQAEKASLKTSVRPSSPGPLNTLRTEFVNTDDKFRSLNLKTSKIQASLYELHQTALENREALARAYQRDVQKLRQNPQAPSFDSDALSQLLLAKQLEKQVGEVVGWFQWFRTAVPDTEKDFQLEPARGVNILFAKGDRSPGFLIRTLELEGEGKIANQHFNFAGTAENITSQPKNHDLPTTFELRAQGDQHIAMTCTLDRRSEEPVDKLQVLCPDLQMDSQLLGDRDSMLVTLGAGNRIQADLNIQASGDRLSGELIFRHSDVSLHVDELHEMAGGKTVALQINQGLAGVDRFVSRVTLSGSVDDYQYEFNSDLGTRFANSANVILTQKGEASIAKTKSILDERYATQLQAVDTKIVQQLQQLAQLLRAESVEMAELQKLKPKNNSLR
ncbi:MAG: TIGR03545 family protein [Mariniblastus sp.]